MDAYLRQCFEKHTVKINPRIANGIAYEQTKDVLMFVDDIIRCSSKRFPEGLEYTGYHVCTPEEEFRIVTKAGQRDKSTTKYDLSRSDLFMVAYHFRYRDVDLSPRYIYLPFISRGGLMWLKGKRFVIQPILGNKLFSISSDSIFLTLNKVRLNFNRITHHIMEDNQDTAVHVVWSWIHNDARKNNKSKSAYRIKVSTLAHYLFAKHGFRKTLEDYAGATVVVGEDDITPEKYPRQAWVICSTTGIRPYSLLNSKYRSTRIRVAIPRDQYTPTVRSLIAGFFYVVDHFPTRFKPEYVDDTWPWVVTLGTIINGEGTSEGMLAQETQNHLKSVDDYMDYLIMEDFRLEGYELDSIDEVFILVIEMMSAQIFIPDAAVSSLYGKQLIVKRYLFGDIVKAFNNFMYKLDTAYRKNDGQLDARIIQDYLNKSILLTMIFNIKSAEDHPEAVNPQCSSDNLFIGITSSMLTQEGLNNKGKNKANKRVNLSDPSKRLHASIAEYAGYNSMGKNEPTGRSRANPYPEVDERGVLHRNEELKPLLDYTQELISR